MNAKVTAFTDWFCSAEIVQDASQDSIELAKAQSQYLLAIVKGRKSTITTVAECVRILGVRRWDVRKLIKHHLVWCEHRGYAVVVDVDEVRRVLADEAMKPKPKAKPAAKREQVPDGWLSITELVELTACRRGNWRKWCARGYFDAAKYVIWHGKHACKEWCAERSAAVAFLRQAIADNRERIYGGQEMKPDPKIPLTPLAEELWRKPEIAGEVAAFWRQRK